MRLTQTILRIIITRLLWKTPLFLLFFFFLLLFGFFYQTTFAVDKDYTIAEIHQMQSDYFDRYGKFTQYNGLLLSVSSFETICHGYVIEEIKDRKVEYTSFTNVNDSNTYSLDIVPKSKDDTSGERFRLLSDQPLQL